jgi:tetrapyrrole methylase family protein/MazG family protein
LADPIKPIPSTAIERLLGVIETLRGENGCPWDKKQTPDTMARYLVEEVYELVDAIISKDATAVCEEAGDVLFQLLFVINLLENRDNFCLKDVVEKNVEKMTRRHPHVFGDVVAKTSEKVSENWETIKLEEKGAPGTIRFSVRFPQACPPCSEPRWFRNGLPKPVLTGMISQG